MNRDFKRPYFQEDTRLHDFLFNLEMFLLHMVVYVAGAFLYVGFMYLVYLAAK